MNMKRATLLSVLGAFFLLALSVSASFAVQARPQTRPPEYDEIVAAQRIAEPAARLKEFERLKAAYPDSAMMATIDGNIYGIKLDMADTLEAVLQLQKGELGKGEGFAIWASYYGSAMDIVTHDKLEKFDKAGVLKAVQAYKAEGDKILADPAIIQSLPEAQRPYALDYAKRFHVALAMAQVNAGQPAAAEASLEAYEAAGGIPDGTYYYTRAEASAQLDKKAEAAEGYLNAAVERYRDAAAKAKTAWTALKGSEDGFAAAFEAKQRELPYHPEAFAPPADWKGKTVLAEIFTGSECPPCVGADLGFDGLIESVPVKYLAILEYHLPIPRPDPIMNPATGARQKFYGVNSTPSTFFDGESRHGGGGGRGNAEGKYKQYLGEIMSRLGEAPALTLKAEASRAGDKVEVRISVDKPAAGAEIQAVLVQSEVHYKGSNGILFHKMVVRDIRTIAPEAPTAVFDLAASERATDAYLTEFEKTYTRIPNFKWAERHFEISRDGLKVVVFAQDPQTKKVLNAVTVEVK
jgi:thiol-disulfide isomerase/thioredoxin